MKTVKVIGMMFVFFLLLLVHGCATNDTKDTKDTKPTPTPDTTTTQPTQDEKKLTVGSYYPYLENTVYEYEGKGNEYASYKVVTDYIKGDRVQLRSNNGGTETVKVLENKNGEIRLLLLQGETYYREDLTQVKNDPSEIVLKEPLEKGATWNVGDRKRTITNIDVEVNTPSGQYKTLEVVTQGKEDKTIDYYAPEVGLVKTVYHSNGMEVSSSLSKIGKNTSFEQTVDFYYPNVNNGQISPVKKDLSFKTNDLTKAAFEKEFKSAPSKDLSPLIGPNVKMKSLYLNKDGMVYVDFTKEFVSEMNAGSGVESMILQSITNTLGNYYNVKKVYITLEGKPYSSGHIEKKKGEPFTVSTR